MRREGKPEVSVVVVSHNTRVLTLGCIRSVLESTKDSSLEVIVVDNASMDGTPEAVQEEFPECVLICKESNVGFAAANNQAIGLANGRYVLLLNSDTVLHEGAIDNVVRFADDRPMAGLVGCRTLNGDGTLQRTCFMPPSILNMTISLFGLHRLFPGSKLFGRERMTYWNGKGARHVPVVAGCFMLVRRKALDEVGGLDERFFMFAEEVDWCVRFGQAGWGVWYTPSATITHFGGASTKEVGLRKRMTIERSVLKFLEKYHGRGYVACYKVLLGLLLATRLPLLLRSCGRGRVRVG